MEEDDGTVAVDGGGRRAICTREEDHDMTSRRLRRKLLWASLPDVGQRLHQQGGCVRLGQDQQLAAAPRRLIDQFGKCPTIESSRQHSYVHAHKEKN
uniref:Uncharacterized protein n=1 Tax=Oryza punctata TaxID=4537 RepID=A0A0E0M8M3_ORYPU